MARPLRLEHPGAIWHLTARGNRREAIYLDDEDRDRFLRRLAETVTLHRWRLHAWVLMTNHYHLLLETPEPNLSRGMHRLNAPYSQAFNVRHGRVGHVFQGRYKSILVERESHLLELTRYVVLNPVRAGIVSTPGEWPWSSYRETAGLRPPARWLETAWTLSQFGRDSRTARDRYRAFIAEAARGHYRPWEQLSGQIYLGGEAFRRRLAALVRRGMQAPEIPLQQRTPAPRPSLEVTLAAVAEAFETTASAMRTARRGDARKALALLGRRLAAARLQDVGTLLGVTPWSASRLTRGAEALENEDPAFQGRLDLAHRLIGQGAWTKSQTDRPDPGVSRSRAGDGGGRRRRPGST